MKILHICNDFSYSKVHVNLYKEIDCEEVQQVIFHPLRNLNNKGKNVPSFSNKNSQVIYSDLLRKKHRFLFHSKINSLCNSLEKQIDVSSFSMQYATTLFSDGAIAYRFFLKYKVPYVVAVRSTDVDIFLKYRFDLISLGYRILENAHKIIFVTPCLKEKVVNYFFFKKIVKQIEKKSHIMFNGIENFWIENSRIKNSNNSKELIYVGRFSRYKNMNRLIKAVEICHQKDSSIRLNLVGGDGDWEQETMELIKQYNWINYHGKLMKKDDLLKVYSLSGVYVMPSFETFGLTYIEALSQGLPVLYSKGFGIDGLFDNEIGVSVNPNSTLDISNGIFKLISEREYFNSNIQFVDFDKFKWKSIGEQFLKLIE